MKNQLKALSLGDGNDLTPDLTVDMKKLQTFKTEVVNDGKKAEAMIKDCEEIYQDWKKILASASYLTSEYPTILDAFHQTELVESDFKSGDILKGVEEMEKVYEDIEEVYQSRAQLMHSFIAIERWTGNIDLIVKQAIDFCEKHDQKAKEKAEEAEKSLKLRLRKMESRILHRMHLDHLLVKMGKGLDKSTIESSEPEPTTVVKEETKTIVVKHISMREEAEKFASSVEEDTKALVVEAENIEDFMKKNKTTIDAFVNDSKEIKKDWGASLKAIANVQSIIPLVTKALDEVDAIGNLIQDACGAASLNPTAIIAVIKDGKKAWDDFEAIYQLGQKIKQVFEHLVVLEAFIKATVQLISTGRVLVKAYQASCGPIKL
ncbi:unnamed protein product [Pseudo-nitzschia multistriata]|uniref:Uncharacterized protein n=1 Tax=Pseudo-nitzschia multistriata TaxID=183589 RepID=A0A448ZEY1_9STRA|nr:unnamed protein product [Pseudo-nitzschia multistriata]